MGKIEMQNGRYLSVDNGRKTDFSIDRLSDYLAAQPLSCRFDDITVAGAGLTMANKHCRFINGFERIQDRFVAGLNAIPQPTTIMG